MKQTAVLDRRAEASEVLQRALDGQRLTPAEGLLVHDHADLFELGRVADELRRRRYEKEGRAEVRTFVIDRNIYPTNVCNVHCQFCNFYVPPGAKTGKYTHSADEILKMVEELVALGGTQAMIQGGVNPELGLDYYATIFRRVKERFPQVAVHSLSVVELLGLAEKERLPVREVMVRLREAGWDSLPGAGAEMLVERVREAISPLKATTQTWLDTMRTAHELGLRSSATMVYGCGETHAERIEHLERLRALQDETGGFLAFVPWSMSTRNTRIAHIPEETGLTYLRMMALARVYLDNFDHIQAGWVTNGPRLAQVALDFGADDFGGVLMEEKVVSATGVDARITVPEVVRLVQTAGHRAAQRDTFYRIVREF